MTDQAIPPQRSAGSVTTLAFGVLIGLAVPIVTWAGVLAWERWGSAAGDPGAEGADDADEGTGDDLGEYRPMRLQAVIVEPEAAKVIYLNREGARLRAGRNDSRRNVSSIVQGAGLPYAYIPAFAGTNRRWREILTCVRDRFSAYDVRVVDQRPVESDYVMVMVGGDPEVLAGGELPPDPDEPDEPGEPGDPGEAADHDRPDYSQTTGLAPFSGQVIEDPVVMVFSRKLREHAQRTCETAAMEVAHAYGLDHAMHCGEVMSYLRPCGRRTFRDEAFDCGEHEARKCEMSTGATQNSHQRLLEILGPSDRP